MLIKFSVLRWVWESQSYSRFDWNCLFTLWNLFHRPTLLVVASNGSACATCNETRHKNMQPENHIVILGNDWNLEWFVVFPFILSVCRESHCVALAWLYDCATQRRANFSVHPMELEHESDRQFHQIPSVVPCDDYCFTCCRVKQCWDTLARAKECGRAAGQSLSDTFPSLPRR